MKVLNGEMYSRLIMDILLGINIVLKIALEDIQLRILFSILIMKVILPEH